MGQARWLTRSYRVLAHEGFETNPVVYACVTKLARAVSSVDLHLYDRTRQGDLRKIDRPRHPRPGQQPQRGLVGPAVPREAGHPVPDRRQRLRPGQQRRLRARPSELWLLPPRLRHGRRLRRPHAAGGLQVPARAGRARPSTRSTRSPAARRCCTCARSTRSTSGTACRRWPPPPTAWTSSTPARSGTRRCSRTRAARPARSRCARARTASRPMLTDDQFDRLKDEVDASYTGAAQRRPPHAARLRPRMGADVAEQQGHGPPRDDADQRPVHRRLLRHARRSS